MDETYKMTEHRTVQAGYKSPYTVQAWKRQKTDIAAISSDQLLSINPTKPQASNNITHFLNAPTPTHLAAKEPSFEDILTEASVSPPHPAHIAPTAGTPAPADNALSFSDIVDVVNPLHHIPLVNMAYRNITGDTIGAVGQIIGGALFGGPIGAVTGTINAIVQETTGKDVAGNVFGFVGRGFNS